MNENSLCSPEKLVLSQGNKAVFDFNGNIMKGNMKSKTATRLVREWIDLRLNELEEDWQLARAGKEIKKIDPLE